MLSYSLHCFDREGALVFRHSFEAEHNPEAKLIADAICDACSDTHHRFELWKGDLPLAGGRTLGSLANDGGLSPRARQTVRLALIALLNSDWRVSHSRRLRGKVGAWALGEGADAAAAGDAAPARQDLPVMGGEPQMRRLHRGVEYTVRSLDGVRWSWTATLRKADGKAIVGSLNGSKADAIKMCVEAIDEELSGMGVPAAAPAPAPSLAPPLNQAQVSGDGRTILIAEDERMFRDAVAQSLEACGFKVFQAGDGKEALAILKDHREIALLVSDIRMPGMDGYALAEAGIELRPALKVILMTGYAANPPRLFLDHKIGTFRKPFDTDLLCRRAAELIAVH